MANTVFFIFNLLCFNIICSSHAQKELPKLKGTVKTIHTESDVIDCVNIYQQPAFDHPLLRNHNIEHAVMRVDEGTYYGTKFAATVWNPHVELNDMSLAQTLISAGPPNTMNTIEVGWMTDGYKTLCYNLQCPGFVQISRRIIPGSSLSTISQYGSKNYDLRISVYKAGPNWWLQVGEEYIGYWPAEIFPLLSNSADYVEWGGKVLYKNNAGHHHTTTQMGSGHFAAEKYTKAALFHNLQVNTRDDNPNFHRPASFHPWGVINSNCYSLLKAEYNNKHGDHFFYGGPGYSPSCP
ncbi:hypothetical protein QQ045_013843 [Rhodiola kirilowii]